VIGLLATGYWLLATGYWLLATDYWLLATGRLRMQGSPLSANPPIFVLHMFAPYAPIYKLFATAIKL